MGELQLWELCRDGQLQNQESPGRKETIKDPWWTTSSSLVTIQAWRRKQKTRRRTQKDGAIFRCKKLLTVDKTAKGMTMFLWGPTLLFAGVGFKLASQAARGIKGNVDHYQCRQQVGPGVLGVLGSPAKIRYTFCIEVKCSTCQCFNQMVHLKMVKGDEEEHLLQTE